MSTDAQWEAWGLRDAYFGVLTDERFRSSMLNDVSRRAFFDSGRAHVDFLFDVCRERVQSGFAPRRALDFGCGVGRVAIPLAERVEAVVGVDISPAMLAEAQRNCERYGRANVTLHLSDDRLSAVSGTFDLVHSTIVLQHIEVPRGRVLFERMIDLLAPGGVGAIQVTFAWDQYPHRYGQPPVEPTWSAPAEHTRSSLLRLGGGLFGRRRAAQPPQPDPDADPEMRMYYYNLSELFFMLMSFGVARVHIEFTDHGGALGAFLFFEAPGR
ncbi:MAG: hypothetical protein RJA99_1674 [Pseudomonadota bacterium]|jgi:SAM-dependent methyltransferase